MKILVCDSLYVRYVPSLEQKVPHAATWVTVAPSDEAALAREIVDADIFVGSKLSAGMIGRAKALQLVVCSAAGTNGIAIDALHTNVPVTNTYHHERSIAEYVLMAMVALSRGLMEADGALRHGTWRSVFYDSRRSPHRTLVGQTIGIIGLGRTGIETARLARALGMVVIALRRSPNTMIEAGMVDEVRGPAELPWLLANSRFVAICAPLSAETRGMIGERQIGLMRPDSFLISVGRAEIVDEEALYLALLNRTIAGAAIDVWYQYPKQMDERTEPSKFPFKDLDNLIMTPHHSGQAEENFNARADDFAFNIDAFIAGRPLRNLVPR